MPKYIVTFLLCLAFIHSQAQTTHSVVVAVNQAPGCPIVSGLEETEHIKVFPNPVNTTSFTIQSDLTDAMVQIHDLKGIVVWQDHLDDNQLEVEASNFKSGVYIINILKEDRIHKMKIQIR